jgi:multidrug efflux pump subunit AcrA (membrane-fusion protein)
MKGRNSMNKYALPVLASSLLLFGVFSVARTRPKYEPAEPLNAPPAAEYTSSIGAVGLIEASTENVNISTPVSGLCMRVYVKAGDRVQAGQRLFSLDDRDLQAELEVRKSALSAARAQLEKLRDSPRPEDIPVLQAKVVEAEQAVEDANVQQRMIESVNDKRAIREEDLERRRIATKAAEARLHQAQADLALLKAGAWAEDIKIAEAQVAMAEKEVERLEIEINRLTVTAPFEGEVLQLNIHAGEYAQGGPLPKPLILFGDVNILNLRVDVDEHEAWKVRPYAQAFAMVRGNTAMRVPLRFVRFEPYVTPKKSLTGDSTERVDTRVLQVIYAVGRPDESIHVGQQMDVYIDASAMSTSSEKTAKGGAGR